MLSEYEKNTWQSLIGPNLNRIKYFEEKIPKFQSPNAFFEPENFVRQQLDESVIVEYFNNNVCIKPIQTYYQNSIWRSPDKYFFLIWRRWTSVLFTTKYIFIIPIHRSKSIVKNYQLENQLQINENTISNITSWCTLMYHND